MVLFSVLGLATGHLYPRKHDFSFCCAMTHSFTAPKFCSDISYCLGIPVLLPLFLYGSTFKAQLKGHPSKNALFTTSAGNNLPFETSQFFLCKSSNSYHIVLFSLNTGVHIWSVHKTPGVVQMAWEGSENCDIL